MKENSINLSDILLLLLNEMIKKTEEFNQFNINKISVCCASNRKNTKGGIYAKLVPLRFENGAKIIKYNKRFYCIPKIIINNYEILYIIYFYIPNFFNLSAKDKINVMFHELYHINPEFNGDIRRMGKIKTAHGNSKKSYEKHYMNYVEDFYNCIKNRDYINFLNMNTCDLKKTFVKITYSKIRKIKPVLLT